MLVLLAGCSGTGQPTAVPPSSAAPTLPPENPAPGDHDLALLDAEGTTRRFTVHAPPGYDPASGKKYPLVLAFHGQPGTAAEMVALSKLNPVADAAGFLVVYPDGIRDVTTVMALLDRLMAKWAIDPQRVHATGFSRGAAFTYELAEKHPQRFGSVAPVSGSGGEVKPLAAPVALLTFQGELDRLRSAFTITNSTWSKAAGCAGEQVRTITMENGPTHIYTSQCRGGTEHVVYSLTKMSHEWPADAGRLMLEFFTKHPRRS